jgi:hypothetical protein
MIINAVLLFVGLAQNRGFPVWELSHPIPVSDNRMLVDSTHYQLTMAMMEPIVYQSRGEGIRSEDPPALSDSIPTVKKSKLLPEKISFTENLLWGENGLAGPLTLEQRKYELQVRRTMLTIHQIGGFVTLALMIADAYTGQKVIDGRRDLGSTHQTLVALTIGSYSLTGLMAVLSPPPLIRRDEESTTTLHKTLAWAHLAGMILTPILGSMIGGSRRFNADKAHVHQDVGYITIAIFASAMIVVTF